jgi:hypothetical protein
MLCLESYDLVPDPMLRYAHTKLLYHIVSKTCSYSTLEDDRLCILKLLFREDLSFWPLVTIVILGSVGSVSHGST